MTHEIRRKSRKRIILDVSEGLLKNIDWLAGLEERTRSELILKAIRRFLQPHLEQRRELLKTVAAQRRSEPTVTKAISTSTETLKTGRYEP